MDKDLQRCLDLLKENTENVRNDAEGALLTVCQNILCHPNDKQFRELCLDDPIVEKLLSATGAMECLFDLGFVEADDSLILPPEASLFKLQALESHLSESCIARHNILYSREANKYNYKYNLIPETTNLKEQAFLTEIVHRFQGVMRFEDSMLQKKARRLIPITELQIATMTRIRELQERIKLSKENSVESTEGLFKESDIDANELFLMELMHWFKYKFFTWVDSPRCSACMGNCEHYKTVFSEDPRCSRIEIHKCTNCEALVKFPRYSDPEPLLTLRRGRCGEWANVFTLLCRSLGYDSRHVFDATDHVWTEVWSMHEQRWIHLDPCEDVIDRPLMYEKGWNKKLTYVIAYSKDEVQDVTWRYSRDQINLMKRRTVCSENNLLQLIESLNKYRQCSDNYSPSRKQYVVKRRLLELVELIYMPNEQNFGNNESYQGRTTGSYKWRLARGELSQSSSGANYSWDISKYGETFHLRYSIVKDLYKVMDDDDRMLEEISGWQNGVIEIQGGIFRKVENDWKITYLARSAEATSGRVKWNFTVTNPDLCISTFNLQAVIKTFNEANILWQLEAFFNSTNSTKSLIIPINDCANYYTNQLEGSVKLILTVTVSGGQGSNAWQHAQLFRQSLECTDQSLVIDIQLKKR